MTDKQVNVEIGSLVRLKSGGPVMTVVSSNGDLNRIVKCGWFDDLENYHFIEVNGGSLDIATKDEK